MAAIRRSGRARGRFATRLGHFLALVFCAIAPAGAVQAIATDSAGCAQPPSLVGESGVVELDLSVEVSFVGRRSGRVQTEVGLVLPTEPDSSQRTLEVSGRLERDGEPVDRFRFRFELVPGLVSADRVTFQRAFPPGEWCLVLEVEDRLRGRRGLTGVELVVPTRVDVIDDSALGSAGDGNRGGRFAVSLRQPFDGRLDATRSFVAEAVVEGGSPVQQVELYLDDTLVATHYQSPATQRIFLADNAVRFVRALAHRGAGSPVEDVKLVDVRGLRSSIDVQWVEAFTTVLRRGRPISDLPRSAFRLLEDGVEQEILRFEPPARQPLHLLLLLDVSESMDNHLGDMRQGAVRFLRSAVRSEDRAAVVTFRGRPRLVADWTSDLDRLEASLRGLEAKGSTSFYDALGSSLARFEGVSGRRAIFIFSDGRDEGSRLDFTDALELARRSRVPIYTLALVGRADARGAPGRLARLAEETGGRAFLVRGAGGLASIWSEVHRELRSQYLLAYQSSNSRYEERFRTIEVRLEEPGLEAHTLQGYYP